MKSVDEVLHEMEPTIYKPDGSMRPRGHLHKVPSTGRGRAAYWAKQPDAGPLVYVVQACGLQPIKVGKAVNVEARIKSLQTGSFAKLLIVDVLPGGYQAESRIHSGLKADRLQGEWFDGENTRRFLELLPDFSCQALRHFHENSEILQVPDSLFPPPEQKPPAKVGMKSADFGSNALGHRWRTTPRSTSPVSVRFTEPGADFDAA